MTLWNAADAKVLHKLPLPANPQALAFSNDGRALAAGDEDGGVGVWDLAAAARRGVATASPAQQPSSSAVFVDRIIRAPFMEGEGGGRLLPPAPARRWSPRTRPSPAA